MNENTYIKYLTYTLYVILFLMMLIWYKEKKINNWKYSLILDDRAKFVGVMLLIGLFLWFTQSEKNDPISKDLNDFYKIFGIFTFFSLDWYFTFNKNENI